MKGKVAVGTLLAMTLLAPASGQGFTRVATPDGSRFLYSTTQQLVPSDNDAASDLYVHAGERNKLVTPGTAQDMHRSDWALSVDGSRVVFVTDERLLAADTDSTSDIYERSDGEYKLRSNGPGSDSPILLHAVSEDASRVVFTTEARLAPTDTDSLEDIYVDENGTTTLLSTTPGPEPHSVEEVSSDGTRVFGSTDAALVPFDRDGTRDVYEYHAGTVRLVTTGTLDTGLLEDDPLFEYSFLSEDGSSYVFVSMLPLEPGDANDSEDLYQRKDGRTRLVTANAAGTTMPCNGQTDEDFGTCQRHHVEQSTDGSSLSFRAGQPLTVDDDNTEVDIYVRTGGSISRAGPGRTSAISADGAKVVFESPAQLAPGDTDAFADLYEYANGQNRLLTPGTDSGGVFGPLHSRDLSRLYVWSWAPLVPEDTDGRAIDFYELSAGRIRLVSTGPTDTHDPYHHPDTLRTVDDGSRAFFYSNRALVPEDTDTATDIYEWRDGVTKLVSG